MTETQIRMFKIMLLGDTAAGKTTLLYRYIHDSFLELVTRTAHTEFQMSSVEIEPGVWVKLYIYDISSSERFREINMSYTRGIHGYLLVFDLTCRDSFESIKNEWIPFVPESSQSSQFVLMGHKSELKNRCVSREEAEELAKELDAPYVEASSATGHNVKEAFETLARQIYRKMPNTKYEKCELKSREEKPKEEAGSWSCLLM